MKSIIALALLALCVAGQDPAPEGALSVCYFASWATYRPDEGAFTAGDIDPFLCTHAIYGFAGVSGDTFEIEVEDESNDLCDAGDNCGFANFVALKETNPDLKTLLSVGGWNEASEDFSAMVSTADNRATFIQSSIDLIQEQGFDGLDIDWEFPTFREGGAMEDKDNFALFLDELRAAFDDAELLLTAAVSSSELTAEQAYDTEALARNVDVLSIMTYDFHGPWENATHHNAPLCAYPGEPEEFMAFNVEHAIGYWKSAGVPLEKMVMGIPMYGHCWTLDNIEENGMLAPAHSAGAAGPYSGVEGTLNWNEICMRIQDTDDCHVVHDAMLHEPYMFCASDSIWCSYDDVESVHTKARFAKNAGLGGFMVWAVDADDFMATCSGHPFGLIHSIEEAFSEPATDEEFCPPPQ